MNVDAELQALTDKLANGELTAEEYTAKVDELLAAREQEVAAKVSSSTAESSDDAIEEIKSATRRARAL
ncbi:MAG TPA: hypothetical protein VHN37_09160 [Actinomycetota bacterium]|nr:hypothetical protein [Actinomycetota bacterium]